eukprot:TRINITY_DN1642_c0_g4_i1.p1 TRINITY_DN1642_c0_g4~~TRINITY_DN1642_c0_g4_i1.p1  ORF type:complete len:556 (+),score=169.47 TRINITY_DN1642_c0_g4_i1:221-1888(+)
MRIPHGSLMLHPNGIDAIPSLKPKVIVIRKVDPFFLFFSFSPDYSLLSTPFSFLSCHPVHCSPTLCGIMKWSRLELSHILRCTQEVDQALTRFKWLRKELTDTVHGHRAAKELFSLMESIEKRIKELETFCLENELDDRSILFEKQRLKLRRVAAEYRNVLLGANDSSIVVYDASPTSEARQKTGIGKRWESGNLKEETKPKSLLHMTPEEIEMEQQKNAIRRERFVTSKGLDKTPKEIIHRMGEKDQSPAKSAKSPSYTRALSTSSSSTMSTTGPTSGISSSHLLSTTPVQRKRRRDPRLSYSLKKKKSEEDLDEMPREIRVKPLYSWEMPKQSGEKEELIEGERDRKRMHNVRSESTMEEEEGEGEGERQMDQNGDGSVVDQEEMDQYIRGEGDEWELRVCLSKDDIEYLRKMDEETYDDGSKRPLFLKKGTGHLAYTCLGNEWNVVDPGYIFLSSRGPYVDKHKRGEFHRTHSPRDFRFTGFRELGGPVSDRLPQFINTGIPYTPGDYERHLREIEGEIHVDDHRPPFITTLRSSKSGQVDRMKDIGGYSPV